MVINIPKQGDTGDSTRVEDILVNVFTGERTKRCEDGNIVVPRLTKCIVCRAKCGCK